MDIATTFAKQGETTESKKKKGKKRECADEV